MWTCTWKTYIPLPGSNMAPQKGCFGMVYCQLLCLLGCEWHRLIWHDWRGKNIARVVTFRKFLPNPRPQCAGTSTLAKSTRTRTRKPGNVTVMESLGVHLLDSPFSNAYANKWCCFHYCRVAQSSSTMNRVAVHGKSFETLNCLMNVASMFEVIWHPLDVSSAPRPSVIAKKRRNKDIDQVHEDLKAHKAMGTKNWFGNTKLIDLGHKWNEKLGGKIFNHTSWHVPRFQGNLLKWFVKMSPAVVF